MIGLLPHFPGLAGYASSKHALECFTNTLRLEARVLHASLPFPLLFFLTSQLPNHYSCGWCDGQYWKTTVINVCPGITRTPFLAGANRQMATAWHSAPDHVKAAYGHDYFTSLLALFHITHHHTHSSMHLYVVANCDVLR